MPGNYNKGNSYPVEEQAVFAAYMTSALTEADIPFVVNADTKYYDAAQQQRMTDMLPVVNAFFLHPSEFKNTRALIWGIFYFCSEKSAEMCIRDSLCFMPHKPL